jgi:hypothetical protein
MTLRHAVTGLILCLLGATAAARDWPTPEMRTQDVDLYYRIYDDAEGFPSAAALQKYYIDSGSEGERQFAAKRSMSGATLAAAIQKHQGDYDEARSCAVVLPRVKTRLATALRKLSKLDPNAVFPPVTVLIGRDTSGGTTGPSGVLIGLEVACRANWLQHDLTDRLVHLIAHEYGHVEQGTVGGQNRTVLRQALVEGGAELVAELISGEVSNVNLKQWTKGHEHKIDEAFFAQMDSTDLSPWFYNGPGTPDKPGDLGYWVGYRIVKAYYRRAHDKRAALATILALKDPRDILGQSHFKPGQRD